MVITFEIFENFPALIQVNCTKCLAASLVYTGTRKNYNLWQFILTREDLNISNRMEFNNSVKVLIAYDNQDLPAAKLYSQTVRNCIIIVNLF